MNKTALTIMVLLLASGCQTPPDRDLHAQPDISSLTPTQWQQINATQPQTIEQWLQHALDNNPSYLQSQQKLAQQQLTLANSQAAQWPDLKLAFEHSRRQTATSLADSNSLTLSLGYELDWFGKLADVEQQNYLLWRAEQLATYSQQQSLIQQVVNNYVEVHKAQQLTALYQARANLLSQQTAMLEANYKLGLTSALDLYLARNNLASEQSRVLSQQLTLRQAITQLQQLANLYPSGELSTPLTALALPTLASDDLPAAVLQQRPDVQQAWYSLLAAERATAISFKSRFPSLKLSGSASYGASKLKDLLTGDLLWSWLISLSQPLFDAGKLANEQARAQSNQLIALSKLQDSTLKAFGQVELALQQQHSVNERLALAQIAHDNAKQAEALSFAQYQKGLVSYSTVLDAEKRAVDAQTSLLTLQAEQHTQQIALQLALGRPLASLFTVTATQHHES